MTSYPVTLLPAEIRHPDLAVAWAAECIRTLANPDLDNHTAEYDARWLGRYLYHLARYVKQGAVGGNHERRAILIRRGDV